MKLYCDPVSTTCRPILLLIHETGLDVDLEIVSLLAEDHHGEAFRAVNPLCCVPALDDGNLRLTQSTAILTYLADLAATPLYPTDLKARAVVNSRLAWVMSDFAPVYLHQHVYPQLFPNYRRPTEVGQDVTLTWGLERAREYLDYLDSHVLGATPYLCGDVMTLADLQAACVITAGEWTGFDISQWPNIAGWLTRMMALPSWAEVNAAFYGLREALRAA